MKNLSFKKQKNSYLCHESNVDLPPRTCLLVYGKKIGDEHSCLCVICIQKLRKGFQDESVTSKVATTQA